MSQDKKKKSLTANTEAMGVGLPSAMVGSSDIYKSKTDPEAEKASDDAIVKGAIDVGRKASKLGMDTRSLLRSAKKVKKNGDKGLDNLPAQKK